MASNLLQEVDNERQLKNSETCPEQLTPKLPVQTTGRLARRLKKPDEALENSQNHGKTAHNRRRNLTLSKESKERSNPPQVKKKQS